VLTLLDSISLYLTMKEKGELEICFCLLILFSGTLAEVIIAVTIHCQI